MFKWLMSKRWLVGNVVVYLWPFVYLAIFVLGLVIYDTQFA